MTTASLDQLQAAPTSRGRAFFRPQADVTWWAVSVGDRTVGYVVRVRPRRGGRIKWYSALPSKKVEGDAWGLLPHPSRGTALTRLFGPVRQYQVHTRKAV